MPVHCISPGLAEAFAALVVLVIMVNAFALMFRFVTIGEALRNIAIALCLFTALAALLGSLFHLWQSLALFEKCGAAVVGFLVVLRLFRHAPRRRRGKLRDAR